MRSLLRRFCLYLYKTLLNIFQLRNFYFMYLVQKCRKYINSIENTSAQFFLQENAERNRDYQIDVDVCTMNALFAVKYFSRSIKSHVQLTSSCLNYFDTAKVCFVTATFFIFSR